MKWLAKVRHRAWGTGLSGRLVALSTERGGIRQKANI